MEMNRRSFIAAAGAASASLATAAGTALADAPVAQPADSATQSATDSGQPAATGWRVAPAPIADDQIVEAKEADFVVVGAAHAGGAVLRSIAEDSDHTVIGVERQARESFFTMGNDVGHMNSQFLRDHGIADVDPVEMYNDWMRRALNKANPSLVMQFMQNCGADMDWWLSCFDDDLVSKLAVPYTQHPEGLLGEVAGFRYVTGTLRVCTAENPDLNMSSMQQAIYDVILAQPNASIDFETTACQLEKDESGRVCAVIAQNADGDYVRYTANLGVVLAAGDFGGNEEMRDELLTHITDCFQPGETWSHIMAQDGSGIQMGVWAGGHIEGRPIPCMNGDWVRGNYQAASIWLDETGSRYCNEFFGEMPFAGKPGANHPHVQTFAIADSRLADNLLTTFSSHDAFEASDANIQAVRDKMKGAVGTGAAGYCTPDDGSHPGAPKAAGDPVPDTFCADTLEELASYMGYDEEQTANMIASVEEWNACCAAGVDTSFGKDPAALFPIDTPPYYAFTQNASMIGGLMVTLGGLVTDKHQNVLDDGCYPIPGLYACGNCCGQRFGVGYFTQTPGDSLGMCIVLGRELGKYLANM